MSEPGNVTPPVKYPELFEAFAEYAERIAALWQHRDEQWAEKWKAAIDSYSNLLHAEQQKVDAANKVAWELFNAIDDLPKEQKQELLKLGNKLLDILGGKE